MLRPISRLSTRNTTQILFRAGQQHQRRNIGFTPPSQKRRSWKGSFARWGLAAGGIYWYTTSDMNLFNQSANEHGYVGMEILDVPQEAKLPTLEEVASLRRDRQRATLNAVTSSEPPAVSIPQTTQRTAAVASSGDGSSLAENPAPPASPESLEEEAGEQGAFNEETGEINWDCPCLGGMAHGPCGEQFRDAFSCFVYSKEEPKGIDCIERFKTMQNCFREHPDIYGAELTDDGDDETVSTPLDAPTPEGQTAAQNSSAADNSMASTPSAVPTNSVARTPSSAAVTSENAVPEATSGKSGNTSADNEVKAKAKPGPAAKKQSTQTLTSEKERSESEALIPRAAFDSTKLNTEK